MPVILQRRAPKSASVDARRVRAAAERMLAELELERAELSVLLTNDEHIRELNAAHRKKDKPTDVLAFAMEEGEPSAAAKTPVRLLGDVVISIDTAGRQARKRKRPLLDEVTHLLAHGLLHLVGYDHNTDSEERRMNAMTKRLVEVANVQERPAKKPRAKVAR